MIGKDCERILKQLTVIIDLLDSAADAVTKLVPNQVESDSVITYGYNTHTTDEGSFQDQYISSIEIKEKDQEYSEGIKSAVQELLTKIDEMQDDLGKIKSLGDSITNGATGFFNSYGSPWVEFKRLNDTFKELKELSEVESKHLRELIAMISKIHSVMSYAIDAKWALITYSDYVQRGYDSDYNGNKPSIRFSRKRRGDTVGNLDQDYGENVNVERATLTPY